MKIAIATVMSPFVYGGAEMLAESLCKKLIENGHQAQVIKFHYSWQPVDRILDGMLAARLTNMVNTDRVIAMKFPAYLIPHPDKKLWLVHQFRQAYELEDTQYDMFDKSKHDQEIKQAIRNADNTYLKALEGNIYTISHVDSDRLMKYNGISSQVLFHPLEDEKKYSFGDCGDYIFCPSRVNRSKRQYLLVEAMRCVKSGVKLLLAGKGDTKEDEEHILKQIEQCGLQGKVSYINRFITEDEKVCFFKNCLAGAYIPFDEDSYGLVTLEGIYSGKAFLTCTDSGGTDIVVKDGITGYRTEPTPEALADAMDRLFNDRKKTIDMGMNGIPLLRQLGITWERVIERLTA